MPLLVTMSYTFCGWGGSQCIYDLAVRKLDQIEMSRKLGIDTGIERPHEYVHTCSIYIYICMNMSLLIFYMSIQKHRGTLALITEPYCCFPMAPLAKAKWAARVFSTNEPIRKPGGGP